jgi:putative ABC transport system substrate-binding protein
MRRRDFVKGVVGSAAVWPLAARAQQGEQMRRIAVLMGTGEDQGEARAQVAALRAGLASHGWVDGSTIHIDYRFGGSNPDQFPALAKELVGLQPEVIFAQSTPVAAALQRETRTIAIVFVSVSDPIGSGFVDSLARPGGNLTGVIQYEPGITGKWLAMLKEIAPSVVRVALVANPKTTNYDYFLRNAQAAAPTLGIAIASNPVDGVADLKGAIESFAHLDNGGLLTVPDYITAAHPDVLISLAARYRLPTVYPYRYVVAQGGLMSYGIDAVEVFRQAASYVNRILRGATAADMPVQVPTKYETILNLKTARTLGLAVPESLLVRADEVIE